MLTYVSVNITVIIHRLRFNITILFSVFILVSSIKQKYIFTHLTPPSDVLALGLMMVIWLTGPGFSPYELIQVCLDV